MQRTLLTRFVLFSIVFQVGCGKDDTAQAASRAGGVTQKGTDQSSSATASATTPASYSGTDERGVPRYFKGNLAPDARALLRRAYGVVIPSHLYISDSSRSGLLKYDPEPKRCATCYVNSYRIGFISVRRRGESWEELQRRLSSLTRGSFPRSSVVTSSSIAAMDPDVQGEVGQMLDAARRAGFAVHVVSTYRSPEQEALLMHDGGGRTHTLTSLHSYGRALDLRIDDGNLGNPSTRRDWIAFRRWVTRFHDDDFRILGKPDQSWDWPHVELPSDRIGFRSIEAAVNAGRECLSTASPHACEFQPHLPRLR
ncbi:MAG TPA: DUF882 domain-containing protein [Gemmatimonadaceae bacterium]|nr:DUF882 domain-containing protein [Gemmatimonadaceae bacterium]